MIELPRRKFLAGLGAAICAPAIVRASSLMPVRACAVEEATLQRTILTQESLEQALWQLKTFGAAMVVERPSWVLLNQSLCMPAW